MSLEIQISSSLLLTSANKRQTFFTSQVLFGVFFSEIMLESLGCGLYTSAAYTRVFTVFYSLRKTKTVFSFQKTKIMEIHLNVYFNYKNENCHYLQHHYPNSLFNKGRYTRGSLLPQHAPGSKLPRLHQRFLAKKYVAQQTFCSRVLLPHIKLV